MNNYPEFVCKECAEKYGGNIRCGISTWHENICDVCGKVKLLTEPRDFGYPDFKGWKNEKR